MFDVLGHYALVWVLLYSFIAVSGILKQYGVYNVYSGFDTFFARIATLDTTLGSQESQFGQFVKYCLDKRELDQPSWAFSWIHALSAWFWVIVFLSVGPVLFYTAHAFTQIGGESLIFGWMQFKGLLSLSLSIYFGITFYQSIKNLNNNPVPAWSVRITFRWGLILSMLWCIATLILLAHGRFDLDSGIILFTLIPMILQYRHERGMNLMSEGRALLATNTHNEAG